MSNVYKSRRSCASGNCKRAGNERVTYHDDDDDDTAQAFIQW